MNRTLPPRTPAHPSRWITRARPKIDRVARPWLILRLIDHQMLQAALPMDDASYAWCRKDQGQRHGREPHSPRGARR